LCCVAHFAHWLTGEQYGLNAIGEAVVACFLSEHMPACACPYPCRGSHLSRLYSPYRGPPPPVREAWLVCRRRAGKSLVLALTAVFLASFHSWQPYLAPGSSPSVITLLVWPFETDQ
jgi:hypothetical protein